MKKNLISLAVLLSFFITGIALGQTPAPTDNKAPAPDAAKPAPKPPDDAKSGAQQAASDQLFEKTKDIYDAIDLLLNASITEQKAAFQKLKGMGVSVLPFIASYLKEKAIFVDLIQQIIQQGNVKLSPDQAQPMPVYGNPKATGLAATLEKYYFGKMLEAKQLFDKEDYYRAKDIASAILTLEKNLSIKSQLQLLKIQCDEMIIQQNVIKAELIPERREGLPEFLYEQGDKIKLTFRVQNVSLLPIEIELGEGNVGMLNIDFNMYNTFGDFNNIARVEEIPLKTENIKLNPNEKKEWTISFDTAADYPNSYNYRTYALSAEIRPQLIKSEALAKKIGMNESIRRVFSPNITLRLFPPDVKPVLADPIGKLKTALEGGVPIDIFLCALLVPDESKPKAIEMLIRALEKPLAKNVVGDDIKPETWETVITNCLKHVTDLPFELNKSTWIEWFKKKQ